MADRKLGIVTLVGMLATFYGAFIYAPTEASMGTVQRIFYIHMPAGVISYFAFMVVGFSSIMFLYSKKLKWDRLAHCSAEIGVLFIATNISMGMLWAKPVWGIWWTWDARLTLQLILALIFVSYLMLGAYVSDPMKRASLQAAFGILGAADVPINYMASDGGGHNIRLPSLPAVKAPDSIPTCNWFSSERFCPFCCFTPTYFADASMLNEAASKSNTSNRWYSPDDVARRCLLGFLRDLLRVHGPHVAQAERPRPAY